MNVFALDGYASFAALQSRVHELWAILLSSSFGSWPAPVQRYTPSTCFETFPFPQPDPRAVIPALEDIGERLYERRAKYMLDTEQGLTKTYNALKDPACHDEEVEALRRLHEELDREVLAAYGWSDIPVPRYGTPTTDAERKALETFEDDIIDRLFLLNAERAEAERRQGLAAKPKKSSSKKAGKKAGKKSPKDDGGQTSLL